MKDPLRNISQEPPRQKKQVDTKLHQNPLFPEPNLDIPEPLSTQ